jgi:hypothetical protein
MCYVDLSTDSLRYLPITPSMNANMASVSGVGLPLPAEHRRPKPLWMTGPQAEAEDV